MRLALLGLGLPLFALPLSAQVTHLSQSTVTLAVTYSHTGATESTDPDDRVVVTTPQTAVSYRNADLIRAVLGEEGAESISGWALVAVWGDWDSEGDNSSYRFFLRKKVPGGYDVRPVLAERLNFELVAPYVAKNLRLNSGEVVSGSELFKAYARASLGADSVTRKVDGNDAEFSLSASVNTGMLSGSGRYVKPAGSANVIYLPGAVKFLGYGQGDNGEGPDDVVTFSLRLGASTAVPASRYTESSLQPSRGPDSTTNGSDT